MTFGHPSGTLRVGAEAAVSGDGSWAVKRVRMSRSARFSWKAGCVSPPTMAKAASELVVFDLDGTLLNADSEISSSTQETLAAPGPGHSLHRSHGARPPRRRRSSRGPRLRPSQAFKNGVLLWHPLEALYSHHHHLRLEEIRSVLAASRAEGLVPSLPPSSPGTSIASITRQSSTDGAGLARAFRERDQVDLADLATLPADAEITSISALGPREAVDRLAAVVAPFPELVAYAGDAFEGPGLGWIDIHHGAGTKGAAVEALKAMLNVKRLVVFGDGSNDLSMFAAADEAYAPAMRGLRCCGRPRR